MEGRKEKEFNVAELGMKVQKASSEDQVQIKAAFQKIVNAIKEVHLG